MQEKIRHFPSYDGIDHIDDEIAVPLPTLIGIDHFGILLQCPNRPQKDIGLIYILDDGIAFALLDPPPQCFLCGIHHRMEHLHFVYGQCTAWQGDKHISRTDVEPRITRQQIIFIPTLIIELLRRVFQAIEKTGTACPYLHLSGVKRRERTGLYLARTGRKNDFLAFLDWQLKITGHIQVFFIIITPLLILDIFYSSIPVGLRNKLHRFVELHIQRRITGIKATTYTVFHNIVMTIDHTVGHTQGIGIAERKERAKLQCRIGMGFEQCISYKNAVLMRYKDFLFTEKDSPDAISRLRYRLTCKFPYIFMPVGAETISLIFMQSQVEGRPVLYNGLIERRKQHMIIIVHLGNRNHQ